MFKDIALKIADELGPIVKKPFIIDDLQNRIVASANCHGPLPTVAEREKSFWQKQDLLDNRKKIGTLWICGQTTETRIYLNLLVELFQQNYRKSKDTRLNLQDETLKNILTGQCEPDSIPTLLAEANLQLGSSQYVFLLATKDAKAEQVVDLLRKMWAGEKAYALKIGADLLAFVLDKCLVEETADELAIILRQLILEEVYIECLVSFSAATESTILLPARFAEATEALRLLKRFKLPSSIANYSTMGLLVFLDSLPDSFSKQLKERYRPQWQMIVEDRELFLTAQKFMEFNLNVSEAARNLFIHRNTLLYRLGKIQKLTGLDYKNFDDMVLLRLLMLLNQAVS